MIRLGTPFVILLLIILFMFPDFSQTMEVQGQRASAAVPTQMRGERRKPILACNGNVTIESPSTLPFYRRRVGLQLSVESIRRALADHLRNIPVRYILRKAYRIWCSRGGSCRPYYWAGTPTYSGPPVPTVGPFNVYVKFRWTEAEFIRLITGQPK